MNSLRAAMSFIVFLSYCSDAMSQCEIAKVQTSHSDGIWLGAIASVGDVDGDGVADVVSYVSGATDIAPLVDAVEMQSGRTGAILWCVGSSSPGDQFGFAVTAADVDGDGVRDVLVGAPGGAIASIPGFVVALSGRTGALLASASGGFVGDRFGWSVTGLGDVNADGKEDFAVGAPYEMTAPGVANGTVHVLSGVNGSELYRIVGNAAASGFGWSLRGTGDANGDGAADLIVGAPLETSAGMVHAGAARQFSGATGSSLWSAAGTVSEDHLGSIVRDIGDVNADGIGDVAIVSSLANLPGTGPEVNVQSGSNGSGFLQFAGDEAFAGAGEICAAGDADDDGFGDIAFASAAATAGTFQIYSGHTGTRLWTVKGTSSAADGRSVINAGDLNGDGLSDLAVSAGNAPTGTVRGFTVECGKAVSIGTSCPASTGALPNLSVIGSPCLTPNGNGVKLRIDLGINPSAAPFGIVFLSPNETLLPFAGGCTLVVGPSPLVPIVVPMFTGLYSVTLGPVPFGPPPAPFVAQAFRADPAVPAGYYATNGVRLVIE